MLVCKLQRECPTSVFPTARRSRFQNPVTVAEIAASIGAGLAKAALAAKVNGKLVDLSHRIESDADARDRHGARSRGRRDPAPLHRAPAGARGEGALSRGAGHHRPGDRERLLLRFLVQAAVHARGPRRDRKANGGDREKGSPGAAKVMARDDAVAFFKSIGEKYKAEIIASIPAKETISLYGEGDFIDLCRGPHVPSTGKLEGVQADEASPAPTGAAMRRTRCSSASTARPGRKKEDQDAYLRMLEEAEKRDHRQARARSSISSTCRTRRRAWCSGIPRAGRSGRRSSSTCAACTATTATSEVRGPQIIDRSLWEQSGHWENFSENMFTTSVGEPRLRDQADELPRATS